MFKVGDILKANMDEAELQYEGCKGTAVYETMMERAEKWRFKVLEDLGSMYKICRVHDKQTADVPKSEVHQNMVLAKD
jgi:hypothetical protein